jgi:hypothetical protein
MLRGEPLEQGIEHRVDRYALFLRSEVSAAEKLVAPMP